MHFGCYFCIKYLRHVYDLCIEVTYTVEAVILTQNKFTNELFNDIGFLKAKATKTPLPPKI